MLKVLSVLAILNMTACKDADFIGNSSNAGQDDRKSPKKMSSRDSIPTNPNDPNKPNNNPGGTDNNPGGNSGDPNAPGRDDIDGDDGSSDGKTSENNQPVDTLSEGAGKNGFLLSNCQNASPPLDPAILATATAIYSSVCQDVVTQLKAALTNPAFSAVSATLTGCHFGVHIASSRGVPYSTYILAQGRNSGNLDNPKSINGIRILSPRALGVPTTVACANAVQNAVFNR